MLTGKADPNALARRAASIPAFTEETVELDDVLLLQISVEMHRQPGIGALPPGLHPTLPSILSLQVWQVGRSDWGPFNFALVRVSCRSGGRARGFTIGAVASTAEASNQLAATFGFPCVHDNVLFKRRYNGVEARVEREGREILNIGALDPEPLGVQHLLYTDTINLAQTPLGLQLVHVEAHHEPTRVERLTPRLRAFDSGGWGNSELDPYHVVSGSVSLENVSIEPVRFICKPDDLALTGTRRIESTATQ
jgi:hypothetical protein